MSDLRKKLLVFVAAALASAPCLAAERLSWFDDASANPLALGSRSPLGGETARFDIKLESLSITGPLSDPAPADQAYGRPADDSMRVYGAFGARIPGAAPVASSRFSNGEMRLNSLGLAWQRRVDESHMFTLSAELGENVYVTQDTSDARAAVSWTTSFGSAMRPRLTGSVFVGDEVARDDAYRHLGRRYFGLSVGGELTLSREHTPYVALQLRRSYYESSLPGVEGSTLLPPRTDDRSLLSAGWRWQVQRNLSLQAEASYSFNESGYNLYNPERSRLFFGTRFDFR